MKIGVIGRGEVGLVAGACFAGRGNDVIGIGNDAAGIRQWRTIPLDEPGHEVRVRRHRHEGRLTSPSAAFDGRSLFTPARMNQDGFTHYSIGR